MTLAPKADNGRVLDMLADACARAKRDGIDSAIAWTYHRVMTAQDRVDYDCYLLRTRDALAYQAGTTESRFREHVRRMVGDAGGDV